LRNIEACQPHHIVNIEFAVFLQRSKNELYFNVVDGIRFRLIIKPALSIASVAFGGSARPYSREPALVGIYTTSKANGTGTRHD
jgi:hypothetical protein